MKTTIRKGGAGQVAARRCVWLLVLAVGGCVSRGPNYAVLDSLAEMEIRIRLLQSEVTDVRRAIAAGEAQRNQRSATEDVLQTQLGDLQQRITSLPERLAELCPNLPDSATVNSQCPRSPEVQRVVVSGDKLVVGEVERVWIDPPAALLLARIDSAAAHSFMHAEDLVEFERDGNKWVRFGVSVEEETVTVERPLKRFVRARNDRRPIVDLRVQLGDVRETVEFVLADLSDQDHPVALGRNFLTDVALVDVGREHVQPAFQPPNG